MRTRRRTAAVGAVSALLAVSGCQVSSLESADLPGAIGTGGDALVVTVELPDVGTLTKNSQVKVDDVAVGTVTDLTVEDWHARATLSLEPDVDLPRDLSASVGVNSLLGSAYVELAPRADAGPARLADGDAVDLAHGRAYPSTEQVLTSASVVLNGGALEQVGTITREANRALSGEGQAFKDLLPQLDSFIGALDEQQGDIRSTIRALDGAAAKYAANRETVEQALDELGPALRAVAEERPRLTEALEQLSALRDVAVPLIDETKEALVTDLENLAPTLRSVESTGPDLVRALGFLVTFPFSPDVTPRACPGGYCNLFLTLDLTNQAILDGFLKEDGTLDIPGLGPLPAISDLLGSGTGPGAATTELPDLASGLTGALGSVLGAPATDAATAPPPSTGLLGNLLETLGGRR